MPKRRHLSSIEAMLGDWVEEIAKLVEDVLPDRLKHDGVKISHRGSGQLLEIEARGYSRSDFEAKSSVVFMFEMKPLSLNAHLFYKDAMKGEDEDVYTLDMDEDPSLLVQKIERFFLRF